MPPGPRSRCPESLAQSTRAVLRIYNVLGQKVATLVDDRLPAGSYRVVFEAGGLPTGVYYYQLEAGGRMHTQQMLLLK